HYTSSVGSFWDNNASTLDNSAQNYVLYVAPSCAVDVPIKVTRSQTSVQVYAACSNEYLPQLRTIDNKFHIDNGAFQSVSRDIGYAYFDASTLSLGSHTAEVLVNYPGSDTLVMARATQNFTVTDN
ncbi:hypothetical protein HDU76_011180, partial [Blyttiomyces sp. JEL0837]